jgi:hypothetical protein
MAFDAMQGMAVLFGGSGTSDFGDTWLWDGAMWTQASPMTAPSARGATAMVYDSARGVTVLFGGVHGSTLYGDTWEWNGTNWIQMFPMTSPPAREWDQMAYDSARGVTVLFGGGGLTDTWEWNGTNWTQRLPAASPPIRNYFAMTYDSARGVTVLFGGQGGPPNYDALNDTWEWDGTNWSQQMPAASPPGGPYPLMVYDSTRQVNVLFGEDSGETWEWDGTNWTQQTPVASPSNRAGQGMTYDSARGVMIVFGGLGISANALQSDTWEWPICTTANEADGGGADAAVDAGQLVNGGMDGGAEDDGGSMTDAGNEADAGQRDAGGPDGSAFNWSKIVPTTVPPPRYGHAMVFDSMRGVTVMFGGYDTDVLNDTWEWDGSNWAQLMPMTNPPGRYQHALAFDSQRGVTVLFGGWASQMSADCNVASGAGYVCGYTWEWDGQDWTKRSASTSPPARGSHVMAYDTTAAVTLLFGGAGAVESTSCATSYQGDYFCGDLWSWNGTGWSQLSPMSSPSARWASVMAAGSDGSVFLFGGWGTPAQGLNDSWTYGAVGWSPLSPGSRPSARAQGAMAYDSARSVAVIFGGFEANGDPLGDTWEWTGTTWAQSLPNSSPPVRGQDALAYDSSRGVTVLFGGGGGSGFTPLSDTWEWGKPQ